MIDITMVPSNAIGVLVLVLSPRQRVPSITIDNSPPRCTSYPPNVNDSSAQNGAALRDDQRSSFRLSSLVHRVNEGFLL